MSCWTAWGAADHRRPPRHSTWPHASQCGAALSRRSAARREDCRGHARRRPGAYGDRLRGIISVPWRAGLRIGEALALAETDLDPTRAGGC